MSKLQKETNKNKRKKPSAPTDTEKKSKVTGSDLLIVPNIRFKRLLNSDLVVETATLDENFTRLKTISKQGLSEIITSLPVEFNSQKLDIQLLVDTILMENHTNLQSLLDVFEDLGKIFGKQGRHLQEKFENLKINWVYETNQELAKSNFSAEISAQGELLNKFFFYLSQWINFLNIYGHAAAEEYLNGLRIVNEAISVFGEELESLQEMTSQLRLSTRHPKDFIEVDDEKPSFQSSTSQHGGAVSFFTGHTSLRDWALQYALRESLAANSSSNQQSSSSSSSSSSSRPRGNPLTLPESKINSNPVANESDDEEEDAALEQAKLLSLGFSIDEAKEGASPSSDSNSRAPANSSDSRPEWMDFIEREEYSRLLEYIVNLKSEKVVPTFNGKSVLYHILENLQELSETQIADAEDSLLNIIFTLTGKFDGILQENGISELVDEIEGLTEILHDALSQKQFTP